MGVGARWVGINILATVDLLVFSTVCNVYTLYGGVETNRETNKKSCEQTCIVDVP